MSDPADPELMDSGRDGRPRLTGWPAIEEHVKRHDKNMVEGFNDDIGTLLIFAGLFSAVLTAFLVVSYLLLQPDNTQLSVDTLRYMSAQIANTSLPSIAPAEPFEPPTSAIWVNSLWFVSLELSLGSALFGMIAKQWLREYMTWTTMSAPVEEILSLRQYRYQAFLDWRVPGIIEAIPALLEVALILFFAGLVILMWTVNHVVAAVSTAVIGGMLVLVAATSFLPVFRSRCPYKSPIGWACVWTYQKVIGSWGTFWGRVYRVAPRRSSVKRVAYWLRCDVRQHGDWKARDAASRNHGIISLSRAALSTMDVGGVRIPGIQEFSLVDQQQQAQISHLSSILSWIQAISQDPRLLAIADDCTPRRTKPESIIALVAADFLFTSQQLDMDLETMFTHLDSLYLVTAVAGSEHGSFRQDWLRQLIKSDLSSRLDSLCNHRPYLMAQLCKTFAHNIARLIGDMRGDKCLNVSSARFVMRTAALAAALILCSHDRTYTACLVPLFQRMQKEPCRCLPGSRTTLFELLSPNISCIVEYPSGRPDVGYALLALQMMREDELESWTRDDADLFVHISAWALTSQYGFYGDHAHFGTLARLFVCMEKLAQISISHRWPECGSYTLAKDTWITHLHALFHPSYYHGRGDVTRPLFPHALIRALDQCHKEGLLGGDLDKLDELVEESQRLLALAGGGSNDLSSSPSGVPAAVAGEVTVTGPRESTSSAPDSIDDTSRPSASTPEPAPSDPAPSTPRSLHTTDEHTAEERAVLADATSSSSSSSPSSSPLASPADAAVRLVPADHFTPAVLGTRGDDIELRGLARVGVDGSQFGSTKRADHKFFAPDSALSANQQPTAPLNRAHASNAAPASASAIVLATKRSVAH